MVTQSHRSKENFSMTAGLPKGETKGFMRENKMSIMPKSLWIVVILFYSIPFFLEMFIEGNSLLELQISIAWFGCLIPTVIFAYYHGFKGGLIATIFSITLNLLTELYDHINGTIYSLEWYLLTEVAIVNMVVTIPISFLVNKLHAERKRLEVINEELKSKNEYIKRMAYQDSLTQLPNRRFFEKKLIRTLNETNESNEQLAVLFIDLDGFKNVNDTLGHDAGDQLLQEVSTRLKSCIREADTVARLAGDEFTVLVPFISYKDAIQVTERILQELQLSYLIKNIEVKVTPSIGIAFSKDVKNEAETLIKYADTAMYQAKKKGKNNYQIYNTVFG